ncbi:MAG: alpha/beta hydrolase [Methylophilaceae bacterium]
MKLIKQFKLSDGTYIRFTEQGTGQPLLLLHTIRNRLEYSDALLPYLTKKFKVYVIDIPGHGDSPINKRTNYDQVFLTDSIVSFIEYLNLNNLTIAGESIGAVLAATIAKKIPRRIKKIFCFNAYDYDKRFAQGVMRGNFMASFLLFHVSLPFGLGVFFAKLESFPTLWMIFRGGVHKKSAITSEYIKLLCTSTKKPGFIYHERNVFQNHKSWLNDESLYQGLKTPVNLIYGESDWSKQDEKLNTMKALGLKTFHTMKETGHFSFLESPKEVSEIILN